MIKILIKDIGPIKQSASISIAPVTLFCGKQGSGKSTIAKMISICLWLEKALVKGVVSKKYITSYHRFRKELCGYQLLTDFFNIHSYLLFESDNFVFKYENEHFEVVEKNLNNFKMPKIMYIPAERNFMLAIEHAEKIKALPPALQTLQEEYSKALRTIKQSIPLGFGDVAIQYDKLNKITWVQGDGFKTKAHQAASGFQSAIPIVLVSDYLAQQVGKENLEPMSVEERNKLKAEIIKIQSNKDYSEETKNALIEILDSKLKLDCFYNIVEEPEQNLYPISQRAILNTLLTNYNSTQGNMLIMTTHSPYILDYLCLNIKAQNIAEKSPQKINELERIVPQQAMIRGEQVKVFEIQDDGDVHELPTYEGMPSDENVLNAALAKSNEWFDELLDIENGTC